MTELSNTGNLPPRVTVAPTNYFFNNFFKAPVNTSSDKNDALRAFFESWTGSHQSAEVLSGTVLYTALNQGMDPMTLVDEFKALEKKQLNAYLTLFLNLNRVNTSVLGISNTPQVNKYIKRSILP